MYCLVLPLKDFPDYIVYIIYNIYIPYLPYHATGLTPYRMTKTSKKPLFTQIFDRCAHISSFCLQF